MTGIPLSTVAQISDEAKIGEQHTRLTGPESRHDTRLSVNENDIFASLKCPSLEVLNKKLYQLHLNHVE